MGERNGKDEERGPMKKLGQVMYLLMAVALFLAACVSARPPDEALVITAAVDQAVASAVVSALTQTAAAPPTALPVVETAQPLKTYQDDTLGLRLEYPAGWVAQPGEGQAAGFTLTSFDPANPPHKLEWGERTVSLQFRQIPTPGVPQPLETRRAEAKETDVAGMLEVFQEEDILIAGEPAVHLTLVSGSGGIIHQVLSGLAGKNIEILIEGNFDLAKTVLDSIRVLPAAGLEPADADTPAAGICLEPGEDTVRVVLGTGNDGLPLAGRCLILHPAQRILLANATRERIQAVFAGYSIDLQPGEEMLLEKPAGEFLAVGVHFLPEGPEIWVK
jgi:hypothetical protein